MQDPESRPPTPALLQPGDGIFPGPLAALALTFAAVFSTAIVVTIVGDMPFIAAVGIGQAIGLGGVATLAARRVPEPQAERLGLCGFDRSSCGRCSHCCRW